MTAILLMSFGIVLLMLPEDYLEPLIEGIGSALIIIAMIMGFDFLSSKKSLIHFIFLTCAVVIGLVGMGVLIYHSEVIFVLGFVFGTLLIVESIHGIYNAWAYARRSGRQGWWTLIPLYSLLIILGFVILFNPGWDGDPGNFKKFIGIVIIFSAIASALRLIWVWPLSTKE